MDYEPDSEVSSAEKLQRDFDRAAERLAAQCTGIRYDLAGQAWLISAELVAGIDKIERAVAMAEELGIDAGFCWALSTASVADLERLNCSTIDVWSNEIDADNLVEWMHAREVPPEYSSAFARGFIHGALNCWTDAIKPRVLDLLAP